MSRFPALYRQRFYVREDGKTQCSPAIRADMPASLIRRWLKAGVYRMGRFIQTKRELRRRIDQLTAEQSVSAR